VLLLGFYRDTAPAEVRPEAADTRPARPLGVIVRQPIFIASVANNVVGSVAMMFVMTAAPLAAIACGHTIDDGANIIQWHLVGMFAPSFFTGALIKRFGLSRILFTGMALNVVCVAAAVSSVSLPAFYLALLCLGVGWNFLFVGGTTLLAEAARPNERAKTQGVAELSRYIATAIATLAAGPFLLVEGWSLVNIAVLPVLALAAGMTAWWVIAGRRPRVAEALS
jgi:hypothetical protein